MSEERPKESWRADYLPAPAAFKLNFACVLIGEALGGFGCYLVGSVLERRDYRDVDVRFIMGDEDFERWFGPVAGTHNALWSLLCITISEWLSRETGLPIDFQIQQQTRANAVYPGRRSAIGFFSKIDPPGKDPTS